MFRRKWKDICREQIKIQACYCYLCGKLIEKEKDLSLDHCIPLSRGGDNEPYNWKPTHKKCNCDKGALTYKEWLLYNELVAKKNGRVK